MRRRGGALLIDGSHSFDGSQIDGNRARRGDDRPGDVAAHERAVVAMAHMEGNQSGCVKAD